MWWNRQSSVCPISRDSPVVVRLYRKSGMGTGVRRSAPRPAGRGRTRQSKKHCRETRPRRSQPVHLLPLSLYTCSSDEGQRFSRNCQCLLWLTCVPLPIATWVSVRSVGGGSGVGAIGWTALVRSHGIEVREFFVSRISATCFPTAL